MTYSHSFPFTSFLRIYDKPININTFFPLKNLLMLQYFEFQNLSNSFYERMNKKNAKIFKPLETFSCCIVFFSIIRKCYATKCNNNEIEKLNVKLGFSGKKSRINHNEFKVTSQFIVNLLSFIIQIFFLSICLINIIFAILFVIVIYNAFA